MHKYDMRNHGKSFLCLLILKHAVNNLKSGFCSAVCPVRTLELEDLFGCSSITFTTQLKIYCIDTYNVH